MNFYQQIQTEKELPPINTNTMVTFSREKGHKANIFGAYTKSGWYLYYTEGADYADKYGYVVTHWLKPFELQEVMEAYDKWKFENSFEDWDVNDEPFINYGGKSITKKELITEFLRTNNYIQK